MGKVHNCEPKFDNNITSNALFHFKKSTIVGTRDTFKILSCLWMEEDDTFILVGVHRCCRGKVGGSGHRCGSFFSEGGQKDPLEY